jgi:von Willebrand factor type A domain
MSSDDRGPLANAPATNQIRQLSNNRLGAVFSALYSFWSARHAATTTGRRTIGVRRDAYSVILFNEAIMRVLTNDFTGSPDQLLSVVLNNKASGGTNFSAALRAGQAVMEENWTTERHVV